MSAQWQQMKEILQSALERPSDERAGFLDNACADDDSLRRKIEDLLASAKNADSFIEQAAIGEVAEILVDESKNLQIGERFNHYKILAPLGAGGMGEVYLAEDTKLNRRVALKLISASASNDPNANRRLLREAQTAAALDHPHICQIYEIAETDSRFFIVMQYVEGETLAEKLERETLTLRETLDLAVQIADALANAHSRQVIHRDIKPANIIVNNRGQAKILDFGLAKIFGGNPNAGSEDETAQLLSQANMIVGTAPYMSPEQARGERLDARTDIFSFGAMLYEMLSGKQPFKRESHAEIISALLHYEPPIAKTIPDAPTELQRIVRKCLAKDKEERYQTARDLWIDLQTLKKELDFQDKFDRVTESPGEARTQIFDAAETTDENQNRTSAEEMKASGGKNRRPVFIFGLIIALFAIVGFGYWFFANNSSATKQIESIAVLPFENESGSADTEYLSDGMTETLISRLSQLPKLNVKARSSVFRYKGKKIALPKIGQELNVQAILTGRVVQRGNDLTLYIELVDAATENTLWKADYNRPMTNLVALQSDIARDVSNKLQLKLSGADAQKLAKNYTENAEAYKLYLQGRFYLNKRAPKDAQKAIEYFEQAIALDPNYAPGYAGLADAYTLFSNLGGAPPREVMPKAKEAALRALLLDEQSAEARVALGQVLHIFEYDFAAAEVQFKRAIELDPNYAAARLFYAQWLSGSGKHEESLAELRQALEIEPFSLVVNLFYASILNHARRYDESIAHLKKTIELDSNSAVAYIFLAATYQSKGDYPGTVEAIAKHQELTGNFERAAMMRDSLKKGGWQESLQLMTEMRPPVYRNYIVATFYAALGEKDKAFAELEKAYENRENLVSLKVNPRFDPLRDDPRFQDLLRRVGLPQ